MRSREALEAADGSGDAWLRGGPLLVLGHVAASKGDHNRAQPFYNESIEVLRRVGDTWALGIVLAASASLAIAREEYTQASVQASEALSLCEELEDPRGIAWSLEVFAGLLAATGLADGAARLWGAAEGLLESVGGSLNPSSAETIAKGMHCVHQEGSQVFKYAVRRMAEMAAHLLERNGFTKDDLKLLVPHQANLRIIRATQERLGVDDSKVMVNIDKYGNTTAGTIPLGLRDAVDQGRLRKGDLVLIVTVGAGYTSGAVLLRWAY